MASMALDALFATRLLAALAPLGDSTEHEKKGTVHVSRGGRRLVSIMHAPVKSRGRMLNKLFNAEDHMHKPRPRPKANVDTVRAGLVVYDADMVDTVLEAVGSGVGPYLRTKNLFAEGATANFGYRTILANLQLVSGLTIGQVFGGANRATWQAWGDAQKAMNDEAPAHVRAVLRALNADAGRWYDDDNRWMSAAPLNIAAEVQIIYEPYLSKGRQLSHLPYKVVRCETLSELARDAGGKRISLEDLRTAEASCGRIVGDLLASP